MPKKKKKRKVKIIQCATWDDVIQGCETAQTHLKARVGETLWFRGCGDVNYKLVPTLMRDTADLTDDDHDQVEQDLFFEFQALAAELRHRGLSEWEYLFYGRHFGVPTRVLDWTDTFGVALYFAMESVSASGSKATEPAISIINPYALNKKTWGVRDIVLPRYLGLIENEFWDFGELLVASGKWFWNGPVAVYPTQLNDRVRAQRGWFTIHGNKRDPLEDQLPGHVVKLVLKPGCHKEALEFLRHAGFNRFSIYPDLDNLAAWIRESNQQWISQHTGGKRKRSHKGKAAGKTKRKGALPRVQAQ
jgi:FRG domain